MAIKEQLLERARAAGAKLVDAERQVEAARREYHAMVRRIHLAGGSCREIAQALELSHQRVQQMVGNAGGSWWHRIWRSRNAKRDLSCTFCKQPNNQVAKLIAGPEVFICDACVELAEERVTTGSTPGTGGLFALAKERAKVRCSFCRKGKMINRMLLTSPAANICSECLHACRQILMDSIP